MKATDTFTDIEFGGPAVYRILVQGPLNEAWSDRLAGMAITATDRGDRPIHTTLVGPLRDQAELSGVLGTLYSLHLSILQVEKVEEGEDEA